MSGHIALVPVSGTWVQHAPAGGRALDVRPRPRPGRFHRPGEVALYLAEQPEGAWAEWYRWLAEQRIAPMAGLPRKLWRVAVDLEHVADLSTQAQRREARVPLRMRPSSRQWPVFQAFATKMRSEGAEGIVYASAARNRTRCLVVFEAGLAGLSVVGQPTTVIAPPPPPRGLRT